MREKTREKRGKIRHVETRNRGEKKKRGIGRDWAEGSGIYRAGTGNEGWRKISISWSTFSKNRINRKCSISSDFIGTIALVTACGDKNNNNNTAVLWVTKLTFKSWHFSKTGKYSELDNPLTFRYQKCRDAHLCSDENTIILLSLPLISTKITKSEKFELYFFEITMWWQAFYVWMQKEKFEMGRKKKYRVFIHNLTTYFWISLEQLFENN